MIDAAASLVESFIDGIEQNKGQITDGLARTAVSAANGLIQITPQLMVIGAEFIVAMASGVIEHAPELGAAAKEVVTYLMNAAKEALASYVDFLGDESVAPFEKILALIPAVAAGFLAFKKISGMVKSVQGFVTALKGAGKAAPQLQRDSAKQAQPCRQRLKIFWEQVSDLEWRLQGYGFWQMQRSGLQMPAL